ncbi:hypothetical protein RND81_02G157300 [Saponaria officinalis]
MWFAEPFSCAFCLSGGRSLRVINGLRESWDYEIYASTELCPLCCTAIYLLGIKVVYGTKALGFSKFVVAASMGIVMYKDVGMDSKQVKPTKNIHVLHNKTKNINKKQEEEEERGRRKRKE